MGTPLDGVDALFADLDGVVYQGPAAIPGAVAALERVTARGIRVGYITNNASRTDAQVAEHLSSFGLGVWAADVVTSPQAAIALLGTLVPAGSLIMVVGGEGITDELTKAGYRFTRQSSDNPVAVVQGFSPDLGWRDLAEASFALHTGIPWVATNTDWTIPVAGGIAPGNGTLVSAVHTAVGRLPVVAGKPEIPIFTEAVRRFGVKSPLMVGDRLDTDILGANRSGIPSAIVLTGIDQAKQLLASRVEERPRYILDDLGGLFEKYPETKSKRRDTVRVVGGARVGFVGNTLEIHEAGPKRVDLIRAACALVWESERPIYSLSIPDELLH